MPELRDQLLHALADRYAIEREIGAGGMATVYLARDLKHDRHVALKVLDPELAAVMGVERFLAEIRVTAHLQHPNLLPLFDSGETANGSLFYVMPFVEGESLRHRLDREKQLPIDEALRITTAIASALDYAHRHHVIHRDLKPENVLFHEGQPLVADFGIALAVSQAGGHRITQTGLSLGTPAYMSPEQATGDRAIDGRTDIYSLGAILYEMLTGEPPHTGTTAQAIIVEVRRQFREMPGIMDYSQRPDYARVVDITTRAALRQMVLPGAVAVATPIIVGLLLGHEAIAGMLMVGTIAGVLLATVLNNGGGAWDNAKKYIESGHLTDENGTVLGKRTPAHAAAVVGDTVGDPFKDTAGPSLHVLVKLLATITLVLAPLFIR